jgi:hypothetical protein
MPESSCLDPISRGTQRLLEALRSKHGMARRRTLDSKVKQLHKQRTYGLQLCNIHSLAAWSNNFIAFKKAVAILETGGTDQGALHKTKGCSHPELAAEENGLESQTYK